MSEEVLLKYYLCIAKNSRKNRIEMAVLDIIAAVAGIGQVMTGPVGWAIFFFAMIPLVPLCTLWRLKRQAKKMHKVYDSLRRTEIDFRFYETHMEATTAESWVTLEYSRLQKIIETDRYFYLMQANDAGAIVPKEECSKELVSLLRKMKMNTDTAPKRSATAVLAALLLLTAAACHPSGTDAVPAAGDSLAEGYLDSMLGSRHKAEENFPEYEGQKFVSGRDTAEYKRCLARLKRLIHGNIPAKVLCDATPRSEQEWHIWYETVECQWVEPAPDGRSQQTMFDMTGTLREQALADSAGVMEAYMLMGEFADGYVAEAVFDDLIGIEEERPAKFAQLRKQRTRFWNERYNEWKEVLADY